MKPAALDSNAACTLVREFAGRRVLVIGDVLLDRYWWGTVTRISPEAPVPVVLKSRSSIAPGGAANVAANIAALGGIPCLVGVTGDDAGQADLHAALAERGIDTGGLICDPHRATTVKTRVVAHNQHVVRVDEEDTYPVNGAVAMQVLARALEALEAPHACEMVVISDYAKGLLSEAVLQAVLSASSARGRRVIVDPKGRDYARYRGAYLLCPNRKEAMLAAGMEEEGPEHVLRAATCLMSKIRLETLLVTHGEAGMTLFERGREAVEIPSVARSVYDVTGAGDTVIATLALGLAAGASLVTGCQIANLAAGLAVEQVGTASVDFEQLSEELVRRRGDPLEQALGAA
jgi:D-beta-D-heptose 7-phosphate kinase/D-beta-D-heptose 1-phosphate adenosyltransferase